MAPRLCVGYRNVPCCFNCNDDGRPALAVRDDRCLWCHPGEMQRRLASRRLGKLVENTLDNFTDDVRALAEERIRQFHDMPEAAIQEALRDRAHVPTRLLALPAPVMRKRRLTRKGPAYRLWLDVRVVRRRCRGKGCPSRYWAPGMIAVAPAVEAD